MKKEDCLSGDWASVGLSDGSKGEVASRRLESHTKACRKHGVEIDRSIYTTGYTKGLKTYCTTPNGYTSGSKFANNQYDRSAYQDVCPEDLELDYLQGYMQGLYTTLRKFQAQVAEAEQEATGQRAALLLLTVLNSSKADALEEEVDENSMDINEKKSSITAITNEIDKWMLARPDLQEFLNSQ